MKKIELQNVTKKIGSKCIVDGVTENIHSGEVFGLLGPNGTGKTARPQGSEKYSNNRENQYHRHTGTHWKTVHHKYNP